MAETGAHARRLTTHCELVSSGGTVLLRGSPEYTHWVVWTLAGRDFVCFEPWTCPGNALDTGERLLVLTPTESRSQKALFWRVIAC